MLMITITNMMMTCFCGGVERRQALSLISSRDHCQKFPVEVASRI